MENIFIAADDSTEKEVFIADSAKKEVFIFANDLRTCPVISAKSVITKRSGVI